MKKYILFLLFSCRALVAKETPPPPTEKNPHWEASGSFIYWQPKQDFMELAITIPDGSGNDQNMNPMQPNLFSSNKTSLVQFNPHYAPGFKVGAAYFFSYDKWALAADYTFFHTVNNKHRSVNPTEIITPVNVTFGLMYDYWLSETTFLPVGPSINAKWRLNFDTLNLCLKRTFAISKSFKATPIFGGAAVWIHQKLKQKIELYDPMIGPMPPFNNVHANVASSAWALGPRFGVETGWYFCDCLSLQANIAADLLYTHYRLSTNQYVLNDSTIYYSSNNSLNAFRPEVDGYIGLTWNQKWGGKNSFEFSAGYDFQVWWSQNMIRWYVGNLIPVEQGNLYLQGLTASAKFRF